MDKKYIPKIYLDTNIISRFSDYYRVKFREQQALYRLDVQNDAGEINFFTSIKAKEEIQNTKNLEKRELILMIYNWIENVPSKNLIKSTSGSFGSTGYGCCAFGGGGGGSFDPLFSKLKSFFDHDDAEHIFQAEKSEIEYFLTLDRRTIIERIKQNKKEFDSIGIKIKIVSPSEFIEILK